MLILDSIYFVIVKIQMSSSSKYVYANGGSYTSNIYHKTATAHNMEGAIKMTVSQAKAKGYRACKRCWR